MERFDLASWELSPDSPEQLEGVASGRIRGDWLGKQDQEFLIRTAQIAPGVPVRFARPVSSTDEGNWAFYSAAPINHSLEGWIERRLFYIASNARLGRLFYLNFEPYGADGRGLVVLNDQGHGHLRWLKPERGPHWTNDVLFGFDFSGLNKRSNALEWRNAIERELGNPLSDARFALHWIQLPLGEQKRQLLSLQRGWLDEFHSVWRQILRLDPSFLRGNDEWIWWWNVFPNTHFLDDFHEDGKIKLSSFLQAWHDALVEWFGLYVARSLVKEHPRPLTVLSRTFDKKFWIRPFDSQHERLEAALELRDWARGKVPDELLQTLL